MKHHPAAATYQKIVYWSAEDGCFVGQCPSLFGGGCHGSDEVKVYAELCGLVDEHLAELDRDGEAHPPADAGRYTGKLTIRIPQELHRTLAMRAATTGRSLNSTITRSLTASLHAGA